MKALPSPGVTVLAFLVGSCAQTNRLVPAAPPTEAPTYDVPELVANLKSPDPFTRAMTARALARGGSVGAAAVEAVKRLLEDESTEVEEAAVWALGHLEDPEAREAFGGLYDTPPRAVWQTRPSYPTDAYVNRIQGTVVVDFIISARGIVTWAEVRHSVPALDRAAVDTVKNWRFEPASKAGRAVPSMAQAPVTFRIE